MNWNNLSTLMKIIIVVIIIIIIIIVTIFIIVFVKKHKNKESYTTLLNATQLDKDSDSDPLHNYVNSWINSVKALYSTRSVNENYVESRTLKNFKEYTYLDKNPIITGVNKY